MDDYKYFRDMFLSAKPHMITFVNPDTVLPPYGKELLLEVMTETSSQYIINGAYEDNTWYVKYRGVKSPLCSGETVIGWRILAVV